MGLTFDADVVDLLRSAQSLRHRDGQLARQVEGVRRVKVVFVAAELKSAELAKRRLDNELAALLDRMDTSLAGIAFVVSTALTGTARAAALLLQGIQGLSEGAYWAGRLARAVQQWLGSAGTVSVRIDRKRALPQSSVSLHIALVGIRVGVSWGR